VRRFGHGFSRQRLAVLTGTAIAATASVFVISAGHFPAIPVRYMMGLQADSAAMSALRHQLAWMSHRCRDISSGSEDLIHGDSVRATRIASRWED